MNKNGLSLVELLVVPNIMKLVGKTKIDTYNNQMELFKTVVSKYIVQYEEEIEDINTVSVFLNRVKELGLIDQKVINPINNERYNNIWNSREAKSNNQYDASLL